MRRRFLVAAVALAAVRLATAQSTSDPASRPDPSADIFANGRIPRLEIALEPSAVEKLRREPRGWVRATLQEDGRTVWEDVGIKLKGSFGSFRALDGKPAFTLDVRKYEKDQEFHGLVKLYLNNSVQDPSYLREWVASEIFRGAGHPAARIGHARVRLNGRDLGLYVLKEGFDRRFLARFFEKPGGNFYDGGVNGELDTPLERDSGDGPEDREDLKAVAAACKEPDPAARWNEIARHVDVDAFVSFMALELMTGHWDGYTLNKNNYRVYFDPAAQKARFIPHGMDQVFDGRAVSVFVRPKMLVSAAVMANPEWRLLYKRRLAELLPRFAPEALLPRIDAAYATLKPAVAETMDAAFARKLEASVNSLKARVVERARTLADQIREGEPEPMRFATLDAPIALAVWTRRVDCDDVRLDDEEREGRRILTIRCGGCSRCSGSWRKTVLLGRGRYRFSARASAAGVVPLEGETNPGAGLRISGAQRVQVLSGSQTDVALAYEFDVDEDLRSVELVAELRASKGEVSFTADSLRLARLGD